MKNQFLIAAALLVIGSIAANTQPPSPSVEIVVTLLGTGNPRPSPTRFGPSTLVEAGGRQILIDVGRGAAMRLFQSGDRDLLSGIDLVLLTHLHSDHVVGLPDLWLTGWLFGRERPLSIVGPPGTRELADGLEQAFAFDVRMRRNDEGLPADGVRLQPTDASPGVIYNKDDLKIIAFAVDHRPVEPAYGYRIDYGGRSVLFSGDTRATDAIVDAGRGIDVIVHEVISPDVERRRARVKDPAAVERIIARHTTPEEAGRLFDKLRPRMAVYSHIVPSPTTARDLEAPTRKYYRGPLVVGADLLRIRIGARIRVDRRAARVE